MKIGIVITLYNRANLTAQTLDNLVNSNLADACIILVDDASTEPEAIELFNNFNIFGTPVLKIGNLINKGIKQSLAIGIEAAFAMGCQVVTNLDNDVKLKPNWLTTILKLHTEFPTNIITGFHSTTKNKDGSERHKIIGMDADYCFKESVGGINMLFAKQTYQNYIRTALEMPTGNWDADACRFSQLPIICAVPSVIQHTGITNSSLNHNAELPDVAEGFAQLSLPNVTLIGVDCNHFEQLERAALISTRDIEFGAVKLLTSVETNNPHAIKIPPLTSKEAYNHFVMKQLYDYVCTDFALIIQGDGYVLDASKWNSGWLQYDYIGATWVYKDGMNVGNGGFSLRRRMLLRTLALDNEIKETYPEDQQICRTYRKYLEDIYNYKFAPEEAANRFSIEAYSTDKLEGANKYSGQFGFHGHLVDFTGSNLPHVPQSPVKPRRRGIQFNTTP